MDKIRAGDKQAQPDSQGTDSGKKPYVKPQIIYRAPLEAMALGCHYTGGKTWLNYPSTCLQIAS